MKKIIFFILVFILSTVVFSYPQEDEQVPVRKLSEEELETLKGSGIVAPPGMEIVKVGNHNLIVPKGAQIRKKGGILILEPTNEYMARKLIEIDERFMQADTKQKELKNEIEELKKIIDKLQEDAIVSQEQEPVPESGEGS